MEEFLNRPKTKEQLKDELHRVSISERRLRSSTGHLEQHVKVQQAVMARSERLRNKWGLQCNYFAAFVKVLPEDVKAEALRTFTHASYLSRAAYERGQSKKRGNAAVLGRHIERR